MINIIIFLVIFQFAMKKSPDAIQVSGDLCLINKPLKIPNEPWHNPHSSLMFRHANIILVKTNLHALSIYIPYHYIIYKYNIYIYITGRPNPFNHWQKIPKKKQTNKSGFFSCWFLFLPSAADSKIRSSDLENFHRSHGRWAGRRWLAPFGSHGDKNRGQYKGKIWGYMSLCTYIYIYT